MVWSEVTVCEFWVPELGLHRVVFTPFGREGASVCIDVILKGVCDAGCER